MTFRYAAAAFMTALATPALADATDPPPPIVLAGSVALVSDYLFRGVSQSDNAAAIQGGVSAAHRSGVYGGTWVSSLAGWGTFGGANMELDVYGGYKTNLGGGTALDVGLTWYMYPGGADTTDFGEGYAKLSTTLGPVNGLIGVAYAPRQRALGNFSNTPDSRGQSEDNLYLWGDLSAGIPRTPVTAKAHLGYSSGNPGLGPNGTSIAPTGRYLDYLLGLDVTFRPVTLGLAYVGSDISRARSAYLLPNFASTKHGSSIAAGKLVVSLSAAF